MINAKIIKDSISEAGKRIVTFELEYPRFFHSEFLTHRVFSRNAASSRAIPFKTMLSLVWDKPAHPIHWGQNQSGMQANNELSGLKLWAAKKAWLLIGRIVCALAWAMSFTGVHKQIINRILEPWSHIKVVVTSTEWDNFYELRNHKDAQPEFRELARQMKEQMDKSASVVLREGEWHLPYVDYGPLLATFDLDAAKKLSASLCAQVSYRKTDESVEKAIKIYDRLVNSKPFHASPFEHQAAPLRNPNQSSGNFRGWFQFRQELQK